ncbi:MAG TPA: hypothetical protein PJ991_10570 [Kiritimatiellia bacterium]|nr:hypothetical protein [Kiritimatiellia bacterium]
MNKNKVNLFSISVVVVAVFAANTTLAVIDVLHQQLFNSNPGGAYSTLAGSQFSASGYNGGVGNSSVDMDASADGIGGGSPSGSGSYEGSFGAQGAPSPETGTLRITDSGFLTDYATTYPGYASYTLGFAFYASVVPADFIITISNGTDFYLYSALSQVSAGGWNAIWLNFDSGWIGSGSSIPNPLSGMSYIDISWSRSGTAAQQFYVDDITLLGNTSGSSSSSGGGGGPSAIPEPTTVNLLISVAVVLIAMRRMRSMGSNAANENVADTVS